MRQNLSFFTCLVVGAVAAVIAQPTQAQEQVLLERPISEIAQPLTEAGWLTQVPPPAADQKQTALITAVRLNPTPGGLEVILETAGTFDEVLTSNTENNLITDIPNAQLQLPKGGAFRQDNPTQAIALVEVTNLDAKTIRVTVTGKAGVPTAEVSQSPQALILSVTAPPASAQPTPPPTPPQPIPAPETPVPQPQTEGELLEFDLRAEEEGEGYVVPNANVGTRTDAPLRDIPQSIQVVPRQVIEDQSADTLDDVLRNVSGVSGFSIRGFNSRDNILRDGTGTTSSFIRAEFDLSNVEQVEVLKGPASVLYGSGEPGGTINFVTEQPLEDPAYEVTARIGSFDFYRGALDLTGPVNDDRTILYRLNAAYENAGSFVDLVESESIAIFPVLSFQLGANTLLTVEGGYENESSLGDPGLPLAGTVLSNPLGEVPRNRFLGEPDIDRDTLSEGYVGYRLEHGFNDKWSIRNQFRVSFSTFNANTPDDASTLFEDNRTVERAFPNGVFKNQNYTLQTDVNGEFQTGILAHDLLLGIELSRNTSDNEQFVARNTIDLFNPEYGNVPSAEDFSVLYVNESTTHTVGAYVQDLLSIGEQVKILLGGRFDWYFDNTVDTLSGISDYTEANAFSPRVGIVYQPIEPISLYASYSSSFVPQFGVDREGNPFEPTRGNQSEVGVRTELFDRRLIATLAAYYTTRQNELIPDPVDPDNFSIQLGETRSQGVEFDIAGEPLPGLRLIANYAYTDAIISEGESEFEGNRISGIPLHSGSLWAVYELQEGALAGLGFGGGIRAIGDAEGDFENTYELPSYVRPDALLYYRRNNWRVQLNVENLFDIEYFENTNRRYGQPFTVRGTVSVTF